MTETLTGRTRLRPARDSYSDVLVLQVEMEEPSAAKPGETWRDAKVEDITGRDYKPSTLLRDV